MEATWVYRKPVWNILRDGGFELVLANAAHTKNAPGRKTDVSDAAGIADLLAHGLIRSSLFRSGDPGIARFVAHPQPAGPATEQPYPKTAGAVQGALVASRVG
jgi:Transposase